MTPELPNGPTELTDPAAVTERFVEVGYTVDGLREVLHLDTALSTRARDLPVYQRRLARRSGALADLVAVLALGLAVAEQRAVDAFGTAAYTILRSARVLRLEDGSVTARIRILPHGELWIASDRPRIGGDLHVTGINPPANLLAALTVRRRVSTALDVGTGNGIQALLAAAHADRVVATDINPRALAYARFNAGLNALGNIDFRLGNLFVPVEEDRFDLVVCNPPYVISPESSLVYRDSGSAPAAMCREIVARVPSHLTEGGHASVLVSWPARSGMDWSDRVTSWLAPGADAWLLKLGADDPIAHAADWHSTLAESDPEALGPAVDRWLDYYDAEGIEGIDFGAVLLRGKPGSNRVVRADVSRPTKDSASDQIVRVFDADPTVTEAALLDRRLSLVPGHTFQQGLVCEQQEWRLVYATLGHDHGLDLAVELDPVMVQVVLGLDGSRTGREAVERAAHVAGLDEPGLRRLLDLSKAMLAELYRRGLLLVT